MYNDVLYIETKISCTVFTLYFVIAQWLSKNMFSRAHFDPYSYITELMKWFFNYLIVLKFTKFTNIDQNFRLGLPDKMKFEAGPKNEQNDANWHHFRAKNLNAKNSLFSRFSYLFFSCLN
jgi:hypothetical protein